MSKRVTERLKLTQARVAGLEHEGAGRSRTVYDTDQPGLCVTISDRGTKTFYWYGRIQGRPTRVKIGRFPAVGVLRAREIARSMAGRVAEGKDPQEDRRRIVTDQNLFAAYQLFREEPSLATKRPRRAKTLAGYDRLFNEPALRAEAKRKAKPSVEDRRRRRLKGGPLHVWRNRKLSDITPADVVRLHANLTKERGPYQANRAMALVSAVFEHARRRGYPGPNPVQGLDRNAERSRVRYLRRDEMPRFLRALDELPNATAADALRMLLYTGARLSNVCGMRWEDVDLAGSTWHVPGELMKNGDPLVVRLDPRALRILKARSRGDSPWVFPSHAASGHIEDLSNSLRTVCRRAGIEHLRIHDLRHTLASWMAANGVGLQIIGRQLGHRDAATTAKYAHVDLEPVAAALISAVDAMEEAAEDDDGEPVVLAKIG